MTIKKKLLIRSCLLKKNLVVKSSKCDYKGLSLKFFFKSIIRPKTAHLLVHDFADAGNKIPVSHYAMRSMRRLMYKGRFSGPYRSFVSSWIRGGLKTRSLPPLKRIDPKTSSRNKRIFAVFKIFFIKRYVYRLRKKKLKKTSKAALRKRGLLRKSLKFLLSRTQDAKFRS